jgi:hypothetical protein
MASDEVMKYGNGEEVWCGNSNVPATCNQMARQKKRRKRSIHIRVVAMIE